MLVLDKPRKLGIGVSFYQDKRGIARLIESVAEVDEVSKVIAIDGRYPRYGYPNKPPELSTDGGREICKSYDNVVLIDYPATQIRKRNRYLQEARRHDLDFLCIMDSDEYFKEQTQWGENSWPTFLYCCNLSVKQDEGFYRIYNIRYEEENGWDLGERPRLWYKPWQVRYDVQHFRWIIKPRKDCHERLVYEGNAGRRLIQGVTIKHHRSIRPQERNETMNVYEQWLINEEIRQLKRKYHLPG